MKQVGYSLHKPLPPGDPPSLAFMFMPCMICRTRAFGAEAGIPGIAVFVLHDNYTLLIHT